MGDRKRSQDILVGLVGVSAIALIAYDYLSPPAEDDTVAGELFTTVEQCAADGTFDRQQCGQAFDSASRDYEQTAPRFASDADCEAEFSVSGCRQLAPLPSTAPVANTPTFIPIMAGIAIGSGIANALSNALPVYRTCPSDADQKDCQNTPGGGYYTGSGYGFYRSGSGSSISFSRSAFSPDSSPLTLSRGGFGARAMSLMAHIGG